MYSCLHCRNCCCISHTLTPSLLYAPVVRLRPPPRPPSLVLVKRRVMCGVWGRHTNTGNRNRRLHTAVCTAVYYQHKHRDRQLFELLQLLYTHKSHSPPQARAADAGYAGTRLARRECKAETHAPSLSPLWL